MGLDFCLTFIYDETFPSSPAPIDMDTSGWAP